MPDRNDLAPLPPLDNPANPDKPKPFAETLADTSKTKEPKISSNN